jgi:hypothetical protein
MRRLFLPIAVALSLAGACATHAAAPAAAITTPETSHRHHAERIADKIGDRLVSTTATLSLASTAFYQMNAIDPGKVEAIRKSIVERGYDRSQPVHLLALPTNGAFLVLDGNHRVAAAKLAGDEVVKGLPAIVYQASQNPELAAAGLRFARSQGMLDDDQVRRFSPRLTHKQEKRVDSMLTLGRPLFERIFKVSAPAAGSAAPRAASPLPSPSRPASSP